LGIRKMPESMSNFLFVLVIYETARGGGAKHPHHTSDN
jgi:hypothetical protein